MKKCLAALVMPAILLFAGCESDVTTSLQDNIDTAPRVAVFNPSEGEIPFPNNLLFDGTQDSTLNIPVDDPTDYSDPAVDLNTLDGFSTVAPFSADFSTSIDSDSITNESVRVYEVTLSGPAGAVVAINSQLTFGTDFLPVVSSVDSTASTLVISPLRPLKPKTAYFVIITNALKDTSGESFKPDVTYALAKGDMALIDDQGNSRVAALDDEQAAALEPVRQLVSTSESTVTTFDSELSSDDIILTWSFTTESIGDVLSQVHTTVQAGGTPDTALTDSQTDSPLGAADIYVGTLTINYYLTAPSQSDPTAPLTQFWTGVNGSFLTQLNATPVATTSLDIPLMVSIPKTGSAPWPTVIFQHGITSNRTALLGIADTLAGAGFAGVAIDLPLHGVTGTETDGTQNYKMAGLERTFDLDLVNNSTGLPGPDGIVDPSGQHFINLTSLLTSRDNLREGVADLFTLTKALEGMDYDNDMEPDFDASQVYFVGHSLGGIVGTVFLALEPDVKSAVLGMPGGGIAKLLDGSATFGPLISAGLAANGIIKGTTDYESFMNAAQGILDPGDPLNYTSQSTAGRGVLLFEIVGGGGSPSDLVVPNKVPDSNDTSDTVAAPLSGTDPLARIMGLEQVAASQPDTGEELKLWVQFTAGDHSSLLSPTSSAAVTTEMQSELAGFLLSNGQALSVTDASVIAAPTQ